MKEWRLYRIGQTAFEMLLLILMGLSLVLALFCTSGCARAFGNLRNPQDLEYRIKEITTYDSEVLDCKERALISRRWLVRHGYKVQYCREKTSSGADHVAVKWERDGETGYIFKLDGEIKKCYDPSQIDLMYGI